MSGCGVCGRSVRAVVELGFRRKLAEALQELKQLIASGADVRILDVRTEGSFYGDDAIAAGALRVNPNHALKEVMRMGLPREAWLALYCT